MPRFVITGSQMRALEEEAFRKGADALLLMERAAEGVVQNILEMAPEGRVLFVCGKGNNGADGLAAARKGLPIRRAPLAKADIFPLSLVRRTIRRSYSPIGMADRTTPCTLI